MSETIKIDGITAYYLKIPMKKPFRISAGVVHEKEFVVFEGRSGGVSGWGEAAVDGIPFYTYETAETAMAMARRVLAPMVKSRGWASPEELVDTLTGYRGHAFTKAAFEGMFLDIYARRKGLSLSAWLGEGRLPMRQWVEVGPSLGIKDTPEELVENVVESLETGFRRIKIKVKPGKDRPYIEAVLKAFPDITLMVDANNAYAIEDIDDLVSWDEYGLLMIEQPLDQHDLYFHSLLCERMKTPICLDESIETVHLAKCAAAMKAMDILNIKVGRVGGLVNSRRIHDICQEAGIPVWVGARHGTGIANSVRLAAAALPGAEYPSDVGFEREYLPGDLIEPWFEERKGCEIKVPTMPGLGINVDRKKIEKYLVYKEEL